MKYKIMPVIWVGELENALIDQYGPEFKNDYGNLRNVMFGDYYMNDVAKDYDIVDIPEFDPANPWMDETHCRLEKCIKTFLHDMFPEYERVMIDLMW